MPQLEAKIEFIYCRSCNAVNQYYSYYDGLGGYRFRCLMCFGFDIGTCYSTQRTEINKEIDDKTMEFGSNCEVCNRLCKDKCTCKDSREKQDYDIVEKPYHYNVGIEVDKFIDSWDMNYRQGNIIKYVTRYPYKDPTKKVQDLKKAKWYLERLIEKEEEKEKNVPTK